MKKHNYSMPFYTQPIIIAVFFALTSVSWIFLIIGVLFLAAYYAERKKVIDFYKKVDDIDSYSASTKQQADNYSSDKHRIADNYYKDKCSEIEKRQNEIENLIVSTNDKIEKQNNEYNAKKEEIIQLQNEIENSKKELIVLESDVYVDYEITSAEYKNKLSLLQIKEKEIINNDEAVEISQNATSKIINSNIKQILRSFNAETSTIIKCVTIKNIDVSRSKIVKAFETLNKIYLVDGVQLTKIILENKLEQLNLMYSYAVVQENEREQQRAIKEQMLEEEKVRREIEKEKIKLDKEEAQFKKEIDKLMAYLQKADQIEKQLYVDKIKELEEKLSLLEKDRENVLQREQNTRAGFVYIISNIGSFGENIYKIGMTRRLEPLDRVKELSSASVPFEFDVHAMIFSDDAPSLENILHKHFYDNRVNKVNDRKEFYNVSIEEIEKVVKENHNATVTFTKVALAEQYRQSLKISNSN